VWYNIVERFVKATYEKSIAIKVEKIIVVSKIDVRFDVFAKIIVMHICKNILGDQNPQTIY